MTKSGFTDAYHFFCNAGSEYGEELIMKRVLGKSTMDSINYLFSIFAYANSIEKKHRFPFVDMKYRDSILPLAY